MGWGDIAMLMFACVAANHLGLVDAMEKVLGRKIPIVNCCKCFTFWTVLFTSFLSGWNMVEALAVSFLFAWLALWVELGMGFIDTLYLKLYEKVTAAGNDDTVATDANNDDSESAVSELQ